MADSYIFKRSTNAFQYIMNEAQLQSATERSLITLNNFHSYAEFIIGVAIKNNEFELAHNLASLSIQNKMYGDFSKEEIGNGFPTLLSHSSIAIWSAVEALFEDIVVYTLKKNLRHASNISTSYPRAKLKCDMPPKLILKKWERLLRNEKSVGVTYNEILSFLFSDFTLDNSYINALTELSEIRNVIMHRMGVVDSAFIDKFPQSRYIVGETIVISREKYFSFFEASGKFCSALFGMEP